MYFKKALPPSYLVETLFVAYNEIDIIVKEVIF